MSNSNDWCAEQLTCTCVHVYSDGTPLEGSGTSDDPYIHELPFYRCMKLSDGTEITPDDTGCITLPDYLTCILDQDGNPLPINPDTGCFVVPSKVMSHLIIKDGYGEERAYYGGDTIKFYLDGQSGSVNNIELPFLIGDVLYLPQLKVRENNTSSPIGFTATSIQVGTINLNRIKATNFDADIVLSLSQNTATLAHIAGDSATFKVYMINQFDPSTEILIQDNLVWEPNLNSGQRQYVFNEHIYRPGNSTTDTWQLWVEVTSSTLQPGRTLQLDYANIVTSFV